MTFDAAYAQARPLTLVSEDRCRLLWDEAQRVPEGDFAEVGVYKGGSALLLRLAAPDRQLHLFDTFEGHPAVQVEADDPSHPVGRYADTDMETVAMAVGPNLCIWAGEFPGRIIRGFPEWKRPFAFVHIDVDLYRSTRDVLERLVPMLVPGGVAICDDYGFCDGAKLAVDEYAEANPHITLETPSTGQAVLRAA